MSNGIRESFRKQSIYDNLYHVMRRGLPALDSRLSLLYERHERRKRQRESEETLPRKVADAEDILGKSTFSLCHSTPQVPEKTETVKPESEAGTFAAESERYPKVVSADELDALFAEGGLEPVEGQDEPMEYRETDAGEPPIDEDEMLEGYAPKATGLRFEDMGLAVRMAMDDSTATEAERQQAGRALAELKGTPMFDQLTAGDAERERRIASLIELHLADYRRHCLTAVYPHKTNFL